MHTRKNYVITHKFNKHTKKLLLEQIERKSNSKHVTRNGVTFASGLLALT